MIDRSLAMTALHSLVRSQIWQVKEVTWQTSLCRIEEDVKWSTLRSPSWDWGKHRIKACEFHTENMLFSLIKQTTGKTARAWFLQLSSISFWLYSKKQLPKIGSLFCCESNSIALLVLEVDQFQKTRVGNKGSRKTKSSLKIKTGMFVLPRQFCWPSFSITKLTWLWGVRLQWSEGRVGSLALTYCNWVRQLNCLPVTENVNHIHRM